MAGRSEERRDVRLWPALLALSVVVAALVLIGMNKDRVAEIYHAVLPWPAVVAGLLTLLPSALVLAGFAAALWSGWRRWAPLALALAFLPLLLLGVPGRRAGASADRERLIEVATTRGWADAVMDAGLAGFGTFVVVALVLLAGTRLPCLPVRSLSAVVVVGATVAMVVTHTS
ncbi:hypothetical protein [Aeromicrobium massiliense]|uniref:hypothetical protein n=1 Tax=Aeromicrobium massiliense TaxID=1464554 RepID=UPI0002D3E66B|nr:hypothetical protein [Aeromicrobium massiliense]